MIGDRVYNVKDGDIVWLQFGAKPLRFLLSQDLADVINEENIPAWADEN